MAWETGWMVVKWMPAVLSLRVTAGVPLESRFSKTRARHICEVASHWPGTFMGETAERRSRTCRRDLFGDRSA